LDEPLALLAALNWFNENKISVQSYASEQIGHPDNRGFGFEDVLAVYFMEAFSDGAWLDEIFTFQGDIPTWSSETAELVALMATDSELKGVKVGRSNCADVCLGFKAKTYKEDLQWLGNERKTPFLFPSNHMGPDLLFALRLSEDRYLWVVVQAKYCSEAKLSREDTAKALKSVTPSQFFVNKVGSYSFVFLISHGFL
jgi:hypothetical protein